MLKNATLRQGGQKMFTISIKHHVGIDELVAITIAEFLSEDRESIKPFSKSKLEEGLRQTLGNKGSNYFVGGVWQDIDPWNDIDPETKKKLIEIAEKRIEEFYPELFTGVKTNAN